MTKLKEQIKIRESLTVRVIKHKPEPEKKKSKNVLRQVR